MCSSTRVSFRINDLARKMEIVKEISQQNGNNNTKRTKCAHANFEFIKALCANRISVEAGLARITSVLALGPLVHHILFPLKI